MDGISLANCLVDRLFGNSIENHGIKIIAEQREQATMEFKNNTLSGKEILYLLNQTDRVVNSQITGQLSHSQRVLAERSQDHLSPHVDTESMSSIPMKSIYPAIHSII